MFYTCVDPGIPVGVRPSERRRSCTSCVLTILMISVLSLATRGRIDFVADIVEFDAQTGGPGLHCNLRR